MRVLFLVISYLCVGISVYILVQQLSLKNRSTRWISAMIGAAVLSVVAYVALLLAGTDLGGNIVAFLHAFIMDVLGATLVSFACDYTKYQKTKRPLFMVLAPLAVVDAIMLGYLAFTRQLVRFKNVKPLYSKDVLLPTRWHSLYSYHFVVMYAFIVAALVILAVKAVTERAKYRHKYYVVIGSIMVTAIVNVVFFLMNPIFNPTYILIAVSVLIVNYYCYVYEPKISSNEITKSVIAELDEMVACFDADSKCIYVNKRVSETLGDNARSTIEHYFEEWLKEYPVFDEWNDEAHEWQREVDFGKGMRYYEFSLRKQYDEVGNYVSCYMKMKDSTELKNEFEDRQKAMMMDSLTGVYRREHFFREVRQILDENPDKGYYIICSNIADFKIYNSVFGEEQGNVVLKTLADKLSQFRYVAQSIGRVSGDVFGGLVEISRFNEEPLLKALEEFQNEFSTSQYKLKIQLGIYEIKDVSEPVSSMCERANLVMKAGKKSLSQTVFYYKEEEISGLLGAKQVISRFDDALDKRQFIMYLQPQVTADGEVLGGEALCRWLDDGNQLIPPYSFIPVLEENGLITKLDLYIWEQAARKLAQWKSLGREDIYISVNISGKDFYYVDVYEEFTSLVERYNLNPRKLKLEVTETAIVQDMEAMIKLVNRLREYGFEVEIDDFGSGYSSLGMLKDLEVDVLKLDMSFLRKASESKEERMWIIMEQMANMADSLGMGTVVEGVEDLEQVKRLSEMGCRVFQGYYFAKPEPVSEFELRAKILC